MGLRVIKVSAPMLAAMLRAEGPAFGFDCRLSSSAPADMRIVGAEWKSIPPILELLVQSAEWDELPEGATREFLPVFHVDRRAGAR